MSKVLLLSVLCAFILISTSYAGDTDDIVVFKDFKSKSLITENDFKELSGNVNNDLVSNNLNSLNALNSLNENNKNKVKNTNSTNESRNTDFKSSNFSNSENQSAIKLKNNESFDSNEFLASGELYPFKISQASVLSASAKIEKYVSKNGKLPNYVTISSHRFLIPEFLYLASKTIEYVYKKNNSKVTVKYNIEDPKKPKGTSIKGKISSKSYYELSRKVSNYITKNSIAPNYVAIGSKKVSYQSTLYIFVNIIIWYEEHGKLPKQIYVNIKKDDTINEYFPKYKRVSSSKSKSVSSKYSSNNLNSKYKGESLKPYLTESKNCQVNDKAIKSLGKIIVKGLKTKSQKAIAIYNWVRDKIEYSFYYNTKYGAKKTASKGVGNCVDQAHLLVALSRSVGIAARYVHGKCEFISGNSYGHVWVQMKVGSKWIVADPTSSINSFGTVENWDKSSYDFKGIYSSLPF